MAAGMMTIVIHSGYVVGVVNLFCGRFNKSDKFLSILQDTRNNGHATFDQPQFNVELFPL